MPEYFSSPCFESLNFEFKPFRNPADIMMKKLVFSGKDKARDDKDIKTLVDAYEERLQSKDKELADEFKFTDVKIKKRVRPNCCGMWR